MIQLASNASDRTVGIILLVTALLTVFSMAHHPTNAHAASMVYLVHGAMLILLSSMFFGLVYYSLRRGPGNIMVLAALVAYLLNYFAQVIAGTVNGFIVPQLAERGNAIPHEFFVAAWVTNQAFAQLGTVATAVAFALWGLDILRNCQGMPRLVGAFGIVTGIVPLAILLNDSTMDVPTALTIYGLHAGFVALLGIRLIQREVP